MGYFSNGTEGLVYQEDYCFNCVHDINEGCPVWNLHLMYSYELANKPGSFLDELIPKSKEGCYNEECRMFIPKSKEVE